MAKLIREVLDEKEIEKIQGIEKEIGDIKSARILENVLHIECSASGEDVTLATYTSLRSCYSHIKMRGIGYYEMPAVPNEEDIRRRRAGHLVFMPRKHEILLDDLKIRTDDILAHKWYLSEAEGEEAGLVTASAHWLKSVSPEFYARSRFHHKEFGIDFEWKGMEKAVCISAQNQHGKRTYYAIVMENDIRYEENLAQLGSGLPASEGWQKKGEKARKKFIELEHARHFCVLGGKNDT